MHGSVAALSGDVLIEWVPRNSLNVVIMFGYFVYTFTYEDCEERSPEVKILCADTPSFTVNIRAQLSVLPAII